jgi:hypothetical protein
MTKKVYEKYNGDQVTDSMLQEASELFSENYGIWGNGASNVVGLSAQRGESPELT